MNIAIASGKGGTGKTTLAVNLASALTSIGRKVSLFDCDVEEPNCHLFLNSERNEEIPVTVKRPVWNREKCDGCGNCARVCRFNAIANINKEPLFFEEMCKSCGLCKYICPWKAITEEDFEIGTVRTYRSEDSFDFVNGTLNVGEAMALPVIRKVHDCMNNECLNIIDAAPGTGCGVVEVMEQSDVVLLVTEPTPFGLHDLKLAAALTQELRIPAGIVINRSGSDDALILDYAGSVGIPVIASIPDKKEYARAYSRGNILVKEFPELKIKILDIYEKACELQGTRPAAPQKIQQEFIAKEPGHFPIKGKSGSMSEIMVISGKGGTGKTSIMASLAGFFDDTVIEDCDVDAPDLHLLTNPVLIASEEFEGIKKAVIDMEECNACGKCAEVCRFNAVHFDKIASSRYEQNYWIDQNMCEGCGFCEQVCWRKAVSMEKYIAGNAFISRTKNKYLSHALLGVGQENSGKLVSHVKSQAKNLSKTYQMGTLLGDGPPGTACPVIASVGGCDLVLIVTEPTVSGVHDMERVITLTKHFNIPFLVIINKADLNKDQVEKIHETAKAAGSMVIGEIPFDRNVTEALKRGKTIVEYGEGPAEAAIHDIYAEINQYLARREEK